MKPRRKKFAIIIAGVIGLSVATLFVLDAFRGNLVFFYSPSDVFAGEAPLDRTFRLGGVVEKGSVKKYGDGLKVDFIVTDFKQSIPVYYEGILPDLFREEQGVIAGSRLVIDWEQVGLPVIAIVSLAVTTPGPLEEAAASVAEIPWIQNCFSVTGEFDLLMVIRARSSDHLGEILEMLRAAVPGQSRTVVVLSTFFEGRTPPMES